MKCEQCVKEGKKSVVYPGASNRTLMHSQPYYDENGEYHYHDMNITTTDYSCSNGHHWQEKSHNACPNPKCDWGKE